MSISVILPVYNEEGNIEKTLKSSFDFLESKNMFKEFEIIVVDDGSRDDTPTILKKFKESSYIKIITHPKNLGYGKAFASGLENSQFPLIFFMDADGQFNIQDLEKLVSYFGQYDIVTGYREKRQDSLYRIILGKAYAFLISLLFGLKLKDVNCGFKLIKKKVLDGLNFICSGPLAYCDILVNAKNKGFKIKEVPVSHYPRRKGKQTGGSLRIIFIAIKELLILGRAVRTKRNEKVKVSSN